MLTSMSTCVCKSLMQSRQQNLSHATTSAEYFSSSGYGGAGARQCVEPVADRKDVHDEMLPLFQLSTVS